MSQTDPLTTTTTSPTTTTTVTITTTITTTIITIITIITTTTTTVTIIIPTRWLHCIGRQQVVVTTPLLVTRFGNYFPLTGEAAKFLGAGNKMASQHLHSPRQLHINFTSLKGCPRRGVLHVSQPLSILPSSSSSLHMHPQLGSAPSPPHNTSKHRVEKRACRHILGLNTNVFHEAPQPFTCQHSMTVAITSYSNSSVEYSCLYMDGWVTKQLDD